MRPITIEPAMNGWIIKVGCGNPPLVCESKDRMLFEISRYIDDPETVEKEYKKKAKNRFEDTPPPAPPPSWTTIGAYKHSEGGGGWAQMEPSKEASE